MAIFFYFSVQNYEMPEILFITSNYIDPSLPNISMDHVTFNKFFLEHRKKTNPRYNAVTLNPVNKIELRNNILGNYDILHFSFHGENDYVQISDIERIFHEDFITLFDNQIKAKIIILNICHSSKLAENINEKTNCWVLGWKDINSTEIVPDFTSDFYSKIFNDREPGEVLKEIKQKNLVKFETKVAPPRKLFRISIKLILTISVTLLFIVIGVGLKLLVPDEKNVDTTIISNQTLETDSIRIIYPLNGSIVGRWDTVKVTAYLQPNLKPWVFIFSNTKEGWIPQSEGKQIFNNEWQFNVEFGNNLNSSGETRIIACIIDSLTETYCKAWLENHTIPLDDKTFNDHYKKFKADTLTVKIE